jgi:hypothetical protein
MRNRHDLIYAVSFDIVIWQRHVPIDCPLYISVCCVRSQPSILSYLLAPRPVYMLSSFSIRQFFLSQSMGVAPENKQSQSKKKNKTIKGNKRRREKGRERKNMLVHVLPYVMSRRETIQTLGSY